MQKSLEKTPQKTILESLVEEIFKREVISAASKSTCFGRKVGCIVTDDHGKPLIETYNTAALSCINIGGCIRRIKGHKSGEAVNLCDAIHAEEAAIKGLIIQGRQGRFMYCSITPCLNCAKLMVNHGIKELHAYNVYPDSEGIKYLKDNGVQVFIKKDSR